MLPGEGHSPGHVRQVQVLLHLQQDFPEEAQALLLELLALLEHLLHALHVLRRALAQLLQGLLVLLFALRQRPGARMKTQNHPVHLRVLIPLHQVQLHQQLDCSSGDNMKPATVGDPAPKKHPNPSPLHP